MGKYKKVEKAKYVDRHHKVQDYLRSMNVTDARIRFKIESGMTPTVRMNFMNDKDFSRQSWVCLGCHTHLDTQNHIMACPSYADLRVGKNLDDDTGLVSYFTDVIRRRMTKS